MSYPAPSGVDITLVVASQKYADGLDRAPKGRLVVKAREAARAEIDPRGAAEAERLADVEAGADTALSAIRQGVTRTLLGLAIDWQRHAPEAS